MPDANALLLWQRLLPAPPNDDVADALRSEIRDPLWLLARQWQLGEFKGEDTGTAAHTSVRTRHSVMQQLRAHFGDNESAAMDFPANIPLDAVVENVENYFDLPFRIEIARIWRQMLVKAGKANAWKEYCETRQLQFKLPELDFQRLGTADELELTAAYHEPYMQSLAALGNGRTVDGLALYTQFNRDKPSSFLSQSDKAVDDLGKIWSEKVYDLLKNKLGNVTSSFNRSRMEYRSTVAAPDSSAESTFLEMAEHHGQQMGWYSFKKGPEYTDMKAKLKPEAIRTALKTLVPTPLSFPGMPHARWWEMEDSTIDLGSIKAQKTDTGLLLLAEFGLLYSNDWLLLPLNVPLGDLVQIDRLCTTDVFGVMSVLHEPHTISAKKDGWRFFQYNDASLADWTWLPAISAAQLQSEATEELRFIRDEMANMVWGVEQIVPDGLGGSIDGASHALGREQWLLTLAGLPTANPLDPLPTPADYRYLMGNTVPPHWIPFMPFRPDSSKPDMSLRRSAMPRILDDVAAATRIRPQTVLLRGTSMPEFVRLDVPEEEIPILGLTVRSFWRRARTTDGSTVTWRAYEKRLGRHTAASGLQFDVLKEV